MGVEGTPLQKHSTTQNMVLSPVLHDLEICNPHYIAFHHAIFNIHGEFSSHMSEKVELIYVCIHMHKYGK